MKNTFLIIILVQFQLVIFSQQKVIQLYKGVAPADNWTERFIDWLTMNGWLDKKK